MTFRMTTWLWLLAAIPFAALFLVTRERVRRQVARRFASERLRETAGTMRPMRPWLLTAGLLLAVIALAGPSRGFITIPITNRESNRVIVLDVSNSMLAEDAGTSRLVAAKAIAHRLIEATNGRAGLVEFEQVPEVVTPLTNDLDAVTAMLDSVQAGEVGQPGSDFGAAITEALKVASSDPTTAADIVLISDGEDQGTKLREALRRARDRNVAVSTILVGSEQGAEIPMPGGPLKDESGRVVTTYAHPEILDQIASVTGGRFIANAFAERALDSLVVAKGGSAKRRSVRIPIDRYQWPLSFAFALLMLGSLVNRGAE